MIHSRNVKKGKRYLSSSIGRENTLSTYINRGIRGEFSSQQILDNWAVS